MRWVFRNPFEVVADVFCYILHYTAIEFPVIQLLSIFYAVMTILDHPLMPENDKNFGC